jgi:hypothetical protein
MNDALINNSIAEKAFHVFATHWMTENNDAERISKRERVKKTIRQFIGMPHVIDDDFNPESVVYQHFNSHCTFAWTVYTDKELKNVIHKQLRDESVRLIKYHTAMPYAIGDSYAQYQGVSPTYGYLKGTFPFIWTLYSDVEIMQMIIDEVAELGHE